mgnify:CR=1 FL=1
MPITYAVKKVKNPKGAEGTNYFHGQAIKTGELTLEKLARRINNSTTVTQTDCRAVLISMQEHIIEALTEGQVVVLDDLGRFQVTLQGKCYPEETMQDKEFSPITMIKGHRITFRPEVKLKQAVADGRDVILDNSVFELGVAFDSDRYAEWVRALQPTWYIVPDVLEDGKATTARFMEFINKYPDLPGKRIGVVQGESYEDYVKCYKAIEPYCDKIGISFDCSWYRALAPRANPWLQLAAGRVHTLTSMDAEGIINRRKPHHLLGVAVPQEMAAYNVMQSCGTGSWIDSVDTSNPVVHGLKGIVYSVEGLTFKKSQKLYTMIDEDVNDYQM